MSPPEIQQPDRHEQAIDAALAALRHSTPPSGLEQRVLQALAERSEPAPQSNRRFAWLSIPATACVILAALSVLLLRPHSIGPVAITIHDQHPRQEAQLLTIPPSPVQLARQVAPTRPPGVRSHRASSAPMLRTQKLHVASPPPPAPLTQQERLLLQIARSGDPGLRAMLNPEVLARRESEGDAEFRSFFATSPGNSQTRNP